MNSYELSRAWFDYCFDNPEKIKPVHIAMYFFIIEHCNRLGWKEKFGLPMEMTKDAIGISNYRTYSKTLNDLIEWGFIIQIQKSKNQYSSTIIAIAQNTKASTEASTKALDKAMLNHSQKQGQSIVCIDKQLNNKQLNNKQEGGTKKVKTFSPSVLDCFDNCINYFPEHLKPKNKNSWLDTIDKLHRIDNIPFELIIEVVKKTRADSFWGKNFLSINKLRNKDKNEVMYISVFAENIKSNNKNLNPLQNEQFQQLTTNIREQYPDL